MSPRDLMMRPSGSYLIVNNPSEPQLRLLHWLGYFPKQINGSTQKLVKTLSPGFVLQAPEAEQAAYLAMVTG